jgi:excisionase family DNA binding protein
MDNINSSVLDAILDALAERVAQRLLRAERSPAMRPRLLTVAEAARYLGRSKHAVEHLISQGRLPVVREGRRVFLDVEELDRWIEQNKSA